MSTTGLDGHDGCHYYYEEGYQVLGDHLADLILRDLYGRSDPGNLAPPNPYSAAALAAWRQGHFLNFNGLTRLIATLWPFLTLPFLMLSARRH